MYKMANMLNFVEKVPPLEHLLGNGVPSVAALDTYIADLDLDLEENAKELVCYNTYILL